MPASARSVMHAIARSVMPTIARSVMPAIARSVMSAIARSVMPAIARSVMPAIARSVMPRLELDRFPQIVARSVPKDFTRSTAASAEYQAWTTTDIRLRPSISLTPANLEMDEDMALDEQAQLSDDEDIESAHILTVNLRQGWWKPFEEERPATPEPAWSIRSSDVPVPTNNWTSALASNYSPSLEDSLLAQTGNIATFMNWFCKRRGITERTPQDLEGPAH
uniref:Uncharacterized protein n=1 Tax=Tanacetum cinerariifolium TaxID=118510 RepID=A0A699GYL6_TANCI|nr:hypothetical protein [Tanacetum cinerariifolium]